ncbi:MAG: hypothetical protein GAK43_01172 [Stenotrophomonas maltophilia]|nr:MAG: hypothetical protein GAK43_01172 [Stenotrophomonas maltophilia]
MNMDTFMPDLYAGAWVSLQMAVQALLASLIPGALLGALCAIPVRPLAAVFRFIANAISLLPVILVLIIFYYGVLPTLAIRIPRRSTWR